VSEGGANKKKGHENFSISLHLETPEKKVLERKKIQGLLQRMRPKTSRWQREGPPHS